MKKNRKAGGVFLAEGPKLVGELLEHFPCRLLVAVPGWLSAHAPALGRAEEVCEAAPDELSRASLLKSPQQVLAVFEQPQEESIPPMGSESLWLALDNVQDPGNVGTIIRLADWFGIEHVFCSPNSADAYNPKTVQATMGALARVHVHCLQLPSLAGSLPEGVPVYGTFLDGNNIYGESLGRNGLIVMGNEGNGISLEMARLVTRRICIPHYPARRATSESLNVAIATAIVCNEFRRQAAFA